MILTLRNIRGLAEADLDLTGPITAVLGPNGSGKSSICLALQALLTGTVAPITRKGRGADTIMAAQGSPKGVASLTAGQSRILITWPKGEVQTTGDPGALPTATLCGSGLVSFVAMAAAERAKLFAEVFKTEPTRADLDAALAAAGATEPASDKLWKYTSENGWDSAAATAQENAKLLKGQWREVTGGGTWGSDAGATWVPEDWTMAVEAATEADLKEDVARTAREHRAAIAAGAVAGDRRAELERVASLATVAAQQIGKLQPQLDLITAEHEAAVKARQELPSNADGKRHAMTCPECSASLTIRDGKLIKIAPMDSEDLKRVRMEIASADGKIENIKARLYEVQAKLQSATGDAEAADRAKGELAKLPAQGAAETDVAGAEAKARRAEADLTMWRAKSRADQLHRQITRQVAIAAATGPAGARKAKMTAVLGELNQSLAALSKAMGIAPVDLDQDLDATLGGRAYVALSGSEQWRVRALIQLEIARRDGSAMVVLDGADILDNSGRAGLAGALKKAGVTALVAMTANKPTADAFRAAGLGRSYWLTGGRAVPMDDAAAQRKAA